MCLHFCIPVHHVSRRALEMELVYKMPLNKPLCVYKVSDNHQKSMGTSTRVVAPMPRSFRESFNWILQGGSICGFFVVVSQAFVRGVLWEVLHVSPSKGSSSGAF